VNTWWRSIIEPGMVFNKTNSIKNKGIGMRAKKVELTKITRPRLHPAYKRTELYNLLDELGATPLIMVSCVPGSGKTTLVSSYVESRNMPCLWYRLDRDDEDLATFFYYLGIAAIKINPYNKAALPQVSPERVFRVASPAREYFQKLYQRIGTPFMMVFDNCQELHKDAVVHDVIAEACAALPPGGRIVLISDGDCRVNIPGLRTNRALATLGCEELQLSPREVKEIAAFHGVRLPSDQAANQLQAKVGGWVAGLVHELQGLKGELLPQ
jgi:ATP/maltotriose-dependent transcriptional regulator MalT